ncbi:unnamed protein product [Paramecium octaurelia]|uniref:Uncharacterized protein n=1 Tax=Paramecium octaurelia TaxID=43137 RepID=A0A8S1TJP6_PAROT|nr:unnamed protein product [Paramecium octaurelia]
MYHSCIYTYFPSQSDSFQLNKQCNCLNSYHNNFCKQNGILIMIQILLQHQSYPTSQYPVGHSHFENTNTLQSKLQVRQLDQSYPLQVWHEQ